MIWPFNDPPNVAVFTSKSIIQGNEWIYYVSHDLEDGAWQFHPQSGFASEEQASVVSLQCIADLDTSIYELADLPLGWCAWRDTKSSGWKRKKKED